MIHQIYKDTNDYIEWHENENIFRQFKNIYQEHNGFTFSLKDIACYNSKGELHREDGPALVGDLYKYWYQHNLLHRENGPAVETNYPSEYRAWWYKGKIFFFQAEDGIRDYKVT